jgi:hypothetical protein
MVMNITVDNFSKSVNPELLKNAPKVLKEDFDFVKENIDLYHDDADIKKYIDTYVQKLNATLMAKGSTAGRKKTSVTTKKKSTLKKSGVSAKAVSKKRPAVQKKVKSTSRSAAEDVSEISVEVRFIKRYILMDGKQKTRKQILSFLNSMQRAIEKKQIRKTSKYAKEIMHIQDELIKIYNDPDVGESFKFSLDKTDKGVLEKYQSIANGQKQRVSVRLIGRYIGIHGKTNVKEKAERLLKSINLAIRKKQVLSSDPYYTEFKKVKRNLEAFVKAKEQRLSISKVDLKGLQGIPGVTQIENSLTAKKKDKERPLSGIALRGKPKNALTIQKVIPKKLNSPITAMELSGFEYPTYGFTGKWKNLIGDPSIPFSLMFWSKPGMGKSTLTIELAKYMSDNFGCKVLFLAIEEGLSYTLKEKFMRLHADKSNIHIASEMPVSLNGYDVVIIDSVTKLNMKPEAFNSLKRKFPDKTFVLIFQSTKKGEFRGSNEWEHEVDVAININENGYATASKSRFGGTGTFKVFPGVIDPIYKFTTLQDAEKFVANRQNEKLSIVEGDDGKKWVTNYNKSQELTKKGYQVY